MSKSLIAKFMVAITFIVLTVLVGTLAWDLQYQQAQADKNLLLKADLVDKATRAFIKQNQDSVHWKTQDGKGTDKLFADMAGSQVKQTRLVVRDGQNQPDEFERDALLTFTVDPQHGPVFTRGTLPDGSPAFRYVTPLRAEESCLKCHGGPKGETDKTGHVKEGYKEGDVAGAISVVLPMSDVLRDARKETIRLAGAIVAVSLLVLALIWFLLIRQVSRPLKQLAGVAESIGNGHIRIEPEAMQPLHANRETAVVADAFASMAGRLEELYAGLEQKVAERTAQLREANVELERASRHQSEFLTMISHEFRTPLTSIMTFTELLLDSAAGQVNQEQQEYLTDVLESSQKLLQMINDLLDLSRLEAGKIKLFLEVLDIREVVRNVERTIRPLAERKGVALGVEIAEGLPLVSADGLRVTQVLLNLLGNAVKFTSQGRITVSAKVTGMYMKVAVTDTGMGIAPQDQERIFEKFSQSGRERPEGSGLGLPLAKSLVELHGGRMWLTSSPGLGSTFFFTLPLYAEEGRRLSLDQSEEDPGSR